MGIFGFSNRKTPSALEPPPKEPHRLLTENGTAPHSCPYCGYAITKDNILFVDTAAGSYRDLRKYAFLNLWSSYWDLSDQFSEEITTPGLYYRLEDALPDTAEFHSDLPICIVVPRYAGRTPLQLEQEGSGRGDAALDDFVGRCCRKYSYYGCSDTDFGKNSATCRPFLRI